jgi:aryl-alcohol dehydrogenase-like predicted oxidoreductase
MTEQPPYSLLVRGIDADVLPVAEQFGMGVLPWLLARRSRSRLATSWIMWIIHH